MQHVANHSIAGMDFFTVPTLTFGVLYCFFVIGHERRKIQHFNVTRNPNALWVVQQLREAWTYQQPHRFLHGDHPASNELPKIGDGLRVTAERHVVILDWSSSKEQRRLEAPGINKAVISGAEDFTPVILGAGALVDVGEVSAGHFNGRQDVVWARVIPMVH